MEQEKDEEKKDDEKISEKKDITEKLRENPWILSTFVLGVVVIIFLVNNFSGGITGNVISEKDVGKELISFLSNSGYDSFALKSVEKSNGFYEILTTYKEKEVPFYVTMNGYMVGNELISISSSSSNKNSDANIKPTEVSKSDKPKVELYVFTYCPYGLQMEKAVIPVVNLLKDKIDFKIRQIGAMHGDFEKVEAERQLCIEKNYPEKDLDYILAFAEDTSCPTGDSTCVSTKVNSLFSNFGMDVSKINSCIASEGEKLYNAEVSNANSKGVSGSPTLIINSVETQASRSQEDVKGIICTAFNNAPSECSQTLSTSQASAGFGTYNAVVDSKNTHASGSC